MSDDFIKNSETSELLNSENLSPAPPDKFNGFRHAA